MAVSRRLRYEVLRRDNHRCRYCGLTALEAELTVDHVIPVALGGSDKPENLVACCKDCNAGKSASSPDAPIVANVEQDALRWAAAMRRAAELQYVRIDEITAYADTFYEMWLEWGVGEGPERYTFEEYLPTDWQRTLEMWYRAEITDGDLRRAIRVAFTKKNLRRQDLWKYMCGVIWRQLDDRQAIAKKLLEEEQQKQASVPVKASSEHYAPEGTRWADGVLVEAENGKPVPLPNLLILFDDAYQRSMSARYTWPDVTRDEVLWGYPRYYEEFGPGLQHRLNLVIAEYNLGNQAQQAVTEHLISEVDDAFAEALV